MRTLTYNNCAEGYTSRESAIGVNPPCRSTDTEMVTACREARWYRRLVLVGLGVAFVGGVAMLLGAAVALDSASVPLVIIGGGWLLMGCYGLHQRRGLMNEMSFDGAVLHLSSPRGHAEVPVLSVLEIGYPWYDWQRLQALRIRTNSGTVKGVARFDGLFEVLMALRKANPNLLLKV